MDYAHVAHEHARIAHECACDSRVHVHADLNKKQPGLASKIFPPLKGGGQLLDAQEMYEVARANAGLFASKARLDLRMELRTALAEAGGVVSEAVGKILEGLHLLELEPSRKGCKNPYSITEDARMCFLLKVLKS